MDKRKDSGKIALFPGSFDPFTAGHKDILVRALTLFDEVVVAIGINVAKKGHYTVEQKLQIARESVADLKNVHVVAYSSLTVDFCHELGIKHIVRGVRNMIDFETERGIADANRRVAPDIETIIIPTAQDYSHISSTAVRDILSHGGDTSLFMVPGVKLPPLK